MFFSCSCAPINDIQQTEDDETQEHAQMQSQTHDDIQLQSQTQDSQSQEWQAQVPDTRGHPDKSIEHQTFSMALPEDSPLKHSSTRSSDEASSDFDPDETLWDRPESITGMVYSTLLMYVYMSIE